MNYSTRIIAQPSLFWWRLRVRVMRLLHLAPLLLLFVRGIASVTMPTPRCSAAASFAAPASGSYSGKLVNAPLEFTSSASSPYAAALGRAAGWLTGHVVDIDVPSHYDGDTSLLSLSMIAWWDPSLSVNQSHLTAYTLSDTLWSSWALRQFDPHTSARLTSSLRAIRCVSNGFFDQIFHILPTFHGHANDSDWMHGQVLGHARCPSDRGTGSVVAIRHPNWVPQPGSVDREMARLFVDFAVQYAFHLLWRGNREGATELLRRAAAGTVPGSGGPSGIWFSEELGLMLDKADYKSYFAWKNGSAPMVYAPFKQALFVLAAREMALVVEGGVVAPKMVARLEQRMLDAQAADGSFCHRVKLGADGNPLPLPATHCGTGETTAMVMLALLAAPISNASLTALAGGVESWRRQESRTRTRA